MTYCWRNGKITNKRRRSQQDMITQKEAEVYTEIIKSISHPTRLMMVTFLESGARPFSEIFSRFELDKSTVSKHLKVLKDAGVISSDKKGSDVIYTLEVPCLLNVLDCVGNVIRQNIEKQQNCLCKNK